MQIHRSVLISAVVILGISSSLAALFASSTVSPSAQPPVFDPLFSISPKQAATPGETRVVASNGTSSATSASSQPEGNESECEDLPADYPLRLKLNGERLPLDYAGLQQGLEKRLLSKAKVHALSDGRLLVGLGDTLYMLDARKRVEWSYTPSWILWDFAVVESTGLVYGTAGDNIMFILDGSTGRKLYAQGRNGKSAYGQAVPFGEDLCLITDNLMGYRDSLDEWKTGQVEMIETDGITAWRGTQALWSLPFAPDAELVVSGDRIFAVTKTDKSIYVSEIIPPKIDGKK